jgi:hypothetical protein
MKNMNYNKNVLIIDNQEGHFSISTLLLIVSTIVLAFVSLFLWSSYQKEKETTASLKKDLSETIEAKQNIDATNIPAATTSLPTATPASSKDEAVVVYTPSGQFDTAEKTELQKKLVNPLLDWYKGNNTSTVSLNIEKPNPAIAGYVYKVTYINEGGSNGGFLYGTSKPLEWWLPVCMGPDGCQFSDDFKAKYPEIVKQMESK